MTARHTPGPWQQRDDMTSEGWVTIIANVDGEYDADGRVHHTYDVICVCEDEYGERLPNVSANTRRIVECVNACEGINPQAVPDLLVALERLCRTHRAQLYPKEFAEARAALAKATGGAA
jgi:hypothetical protein